MRAMNSRPIYVPLLCLLIGATAHSATELYPVTDCPTLVRTLGSEWEISPGQFSDKTGLNYGPHFLARLFGPVGGNQGPYSTFKKLFSIYGKDQQGQWQRNLIPHEVHRSPLYKHVQQVKGFAFERRGGEIYLKGADDLDAQQFWPILKFLMEARGQYSKSLKVRKIPSAWSQFQTRWDQMIPEELAEEWRSGDFSFLEIPMAGGVTKGSELREFLKHVWQRIGLFHGESSELEAALDEVPGHVHWRADPQQLPLQHREAVYRAIVGFWGDANDSYEVLARAAAFQEKVDKEGRCVLSVSDLTDAFFASSPGFTNYSIGALTQESFLRVKPSAQGLFISGRQEDLDATVDPNVPPALKRLVIGLRGIGQQTLPEEFPLTVMDLEWRNRPTLNENLNSLPLKVKGKPEVDLRKLLRHESDGVRGLVSDPDLLRQNARDLSVLGDLVGELESAFSEHDSHLQWLPDQVRAVFLIPLNQWLAHPLVQYNLSLLPEADRRKAVARYEKAVKRYVERMNEALLARRNPRHRYQPDTIDPLEPYSDGVNRLYSRSDYPNATQWGDYVMPPDLWFKAFVLGESYRFLVEANLPDLMRMPE